MMGPAAYKLLCNLVTPRKPGEVEYAELVEILSAHHNPTPSEIVQRFKFNSRVRQPGESVANFIAELKALAKFCNFNDSLDDMLRDRLVCGIADLQIQKRLLAESQLSLKRATELALGMEAAVKNSQTLQPNASTPRDENVHKVQTPSRNRAQKSAQACYRCGKTGHMASACRHKTTKCHFCGKIGHLQSVCRTKNKQHNTQKKVNLVETKESYTGDAEDYQMFAIYSIHQTRFE